VAKAGNSVDGMLDQASRFRRQGKRDRAIELLKKVILNSPRNIEALSDLGYCYLEAGSQGQAIAHFRRALGVNPRFAPAMFGLARTSKAAGQKEQALKYYRRYLSVHPKGGRADIARRDIKALQGPMVILKDDEEADDKSSGARAKIVEKKTAVESTDSDN
jgi:tetratricopeptide (TPR) repeat protein